MSTDTELIVSFCEALIILSAKEWNQIVKINFATSALALCEVQCCFAKRKLRVGHLQRLVGTGLNRNRQLQVGLEGDRQTRIELTRKWDLARSRLPRCSRQQRTRHAAHSDLSL